MDWNGKPYHSLDFYLRNSFGEKLYKLALDGGMTCPNRDGTLGTGGCIFCSQGGSGDFAQKRTLSVYEQIESAKTRLAGKFTGRYIAYFQSFTNTYAPVSYLESLFTEAISHPDIGRCLLLPVQTVCRKIFFPCSPGFVKSNRFGWNWAFRLFIRTLPHLLDEDTD